MITSSRDTHGEMKMSNLYNIVDSNSGEFIKQVEGKVEAIMAAAEMNNAANGYKFVAEVALGK